MPIASMPVGVYPINLWETATYDTESDCLWYCLRSFTNQEKRASRALESARIAHFLPLIPSVKRRPSTGKKTISIVPLFTNYLFALMNEVDRQKALESRKVGRIIPIPDQATIDRELRSINAMIESGLDLMAETRLVEGARFRVVSGPLQGVEGRVEKRKGQRYFLASVRMLGQSVEVKLEDWEVERI